MVTVVNGLLNYNPFWEVRLYVTGTDGTLVGGDFWPFGGGKG
jgi:hypothetical protein